MGNRSKSPLAAVTRYICRNPIFMGRVFWGGPNGLFYVPFAQFHRQIINSLIATKDILSIICVAREFGKTKLVTVLFSIWSAFIKKRKYIILISARQEKAEQNLRTIKTCLSTPFFQKIFPYKILYWRKDFIQIEQYDGTVTTWEAKGSEQPIFGVGEGAARPDLIIMDDLEDLKMVKNADRVRAMGDWFNVEVSFALQVKDAMGLEGRMILIGTPLSSGSFLAQAMTWGMNVQKYPGMDKNDESIWPEMHSTEYMKKKRELYVARGARASWDSQIMMNPAGLQVLRLARDKMYDLDSEEMNKHFIKKEYIVRATVDMAYTQKSYSDYIGISVAGHLPGSRIHYLESMRGKWDQDQLFGILHELRLKYPDIEIYVESLSYNLVEAFFREKAIRQGVSPLPLAPLIRPSRYYTQNKDERIGMMVPYWNTGLIKVFVPDNEPLVYDSIQWDGTNADQLDVLDAASFHIFFVDQTVIEEKKEKRWIDLKRDAAANIRLTFEQIERDKEIDDDDFFSEVDTIDNFEGMEDEDAGFLDDF